MSSNGVIKTHQSCPVCKHKKCLTIFTNGTAWCHSHNVDGDKPFKYNQEIIETKAEVTLSKPDASKYVFGALTDRGISEDTARKYGVKVVYNHEGKVAEHMYPYYSENTLTASKIRTVATKDFRWTGTQSEVGLFGENLFKSGGKFLTIVEGECDAMASYQLMGSKWPVVSVKGGAGNAVKDVKNSLEFVEGFDFVVICFDKDKAGREASKKVARILKPGKAKIMTLPNGFKDPNDMLKANEHQQFMQSFWDSKVYTPSGVINISELRDKFHNREHKESVPYPWQDLNQKLYGLRQGELVTLTGGTGLGKSSVTRELEHHLIMNTTDNVGVIALEEDWRRTVDGILSIEANARLYIDQEREKFSKEELDQLFNVLYDGENKGRVWVHAHFGTNSIEEIFSKLRFMIIGCGCKWVVIDHLHMLVSAVHEGDERRAIDDIMTRLRSIVEETGAGLILVSHLRRVSSDKGHEQGIEVSLSHLRGSQSIAQLSDCVIALERNQQADDKEESNTTRLRVLKSRYTGDVGLSSSLKYDHETGRLHELPRDAFEFDDYDNELSI
jgi:twinkle protein